MMNDKNVKHIIEDLLPLYEEGLLSEETQAWLEEQAKNNKEYAKLLAVSSQTLPETVIESPIDSKKMFQQINRRLAIFQIIFVGLSFLLAINTSILNESFGFILWYSVLGFVTFLFYKDMKIVFSIAFLPIFFWSIGSNIMNYYTGHYIEGVTFFRFVLDSFLGSMLLSVIHFIFAIIGSIIAWLVLKLQERN
jgi:hypothetical protein